jgi:hypothetical protein
LRISGFADGLAIPNPQILKSSNPEIPSAVIVDPAIAEVNQGIVRNASAQSTAVQILELP